MAPREIDQFLPGPALSVRRQDGYTVVTISGEVDIASAPGCVSNFLACCGLVPASWSSICLG
jgi:hypothetical protein